MTYPTDAQIEATIRAYVIEKYGTWGCDYWEDAIAEMPRAPIRAAILATERAAWVTDGSVPDHCEEVLICAADGFYITGRFDTQCDMFNTGCGWMRKSEVIAWRKIIGPETLP